MDLRKNIPVQNENSPPSVSSATQKNSSFDKLGNIIFGFMAGAAGLLFLLVSLFSGSSSSKTQTPVETKQVAESNIQQNNLSQQKPVDANVQQNNLSQQKSVDANVQQNNRPQQKPTPTPPKSLPEVQQKPSPNMSKPAVKPVSSPPMSKPNVAAASAGKSSSLLKNVGKIGIGILTKGKVKIK